MGALKLDRRSAEAGFCGSLATVGLTLAAVRWPVLAPLLLLLPVAAVVVVKRPELAIAPGVVAAFLLTRPALLSTQQFTPVGVVLLVAVVPVALLADQNRNLAVPLSARAAVRWSLLFALWVAINAVIFSSELSSDAAKSAAYLTITMLSAAVLFRNPHRARMIAALLIALTLLECASYLVTVVLLLRSHALPEVGSLGSQSSQLPIYAPFTATNGQSLLFGSRTYTPRLTGWMREPGIFQAIIVWAYFALDHFPTRRRRSARALLLVGLLGTQSTAGFIIFCFMLALTSLVLRPARSSAGILRQYLGLVIVLAATVLAIVAPVVGYRAKQTANLGSVTDRSGAAINGFLAIGEHPLGQAQTSLVQNQGINLIALIAVLGVPALILGLTSFLAPLASARQRLPMFRLLMPLALTALLAQPVTGEPGFMLVVLLSANLTSVDFQPGLAGIVMGGRPHLVASRRGRWSSPVLH